MCTSFCKSYLFINVKGNLVQGSLLWKVHYSKTNKQTQNKTKTQSKQKNLPSRLILQLCLSPKMCIVCIFAHTPCWVHAGMIPPRVWELRSGSPYWMYDGFIGPREFTQSPQKFLVSQDNPVFVCAWKDPKKPGSLWRDVIMEDFWEDYFNWSLL